MSRLAATRRTLPVLVAIAVACTVALAARSWVPAAAAVPLVGVLLAALGEVALPLPHRAERRLVGAQQALCRGDVATVEVAVPPLALPVNLGVEDPLPVGAEPVPGSHTGWRRKDRMLRATYRVEARRQGSWVVGDTTVTRTGILGLAVRRATLPVATALTVLPTAARRHRLRLRPRPPQRTGIATRSLRAGSSDEFFALRPYQPGDPVGDINWKATARFARPITNEYLPEEAPRYLLYVDARPGAAEGHGGSDAFERTLELAGELLDGLLAAHAHPGLLLLAHESRLVVPAGGAAQARRLRQALLECVPGAAIPIARAVAATAPRLPARATAILVTPDPYDPGLGEALLALRSRHGSVLLVMPAFPEPAGMRDAQLLPRAAGALLNADQGAVLAQLRGHADAATQWVPGEDVAATLARLGLVGRMR